MVDQWEHAVCGGGVVENQAAVLLLLCTPATVVPGRMLVATAGPGELKTSVSDPYSLNPDPD